MAGGKRYRFVLIEEAESTVPVRYMPPDRARAPVWICQADPMEALLEAFVTLERRGEGSEAWAPALSGNPLSFLLDTLDEAVLLRDESGRALFRNQAALHLGVDRFAPAVEPLEEFDVHQRRYRRRRLVYRRGPQQFVIEITRRLGSQ
jgi:PAS domain-containing protein